MPRPRFFKHRKPSHQPRSQPGRRPQGVPSGQNSSPVPAAGTRAVVEGVLQVKKNFGFVLSTDPAGDVLIQGFTLKLAMDGDRVRARVTGFKEGRRFGEIVEVLTRAHETVVGPFKRLGNMAVVAPDEGMTVRISDMNNLSPKVNELVVVRITQWPTPKGPAQGVLIEVLGSRDTPGVDLEAVIRKHNLPQKFPADVDIEAASFGDHVPQSAYLTTTRELFFDTRVFTIDGADAKDFDDAVSLERLPQGWRLGVHIADVAHYVTENSALDKEAFGRGTSVYFTGSVLPMLPFPLSAGLCSLRPNEVRLTLSCIMDIDPSGEIIHHRVVESAIRSAKRFTYNEVEEILNGKNPPTLDASIVADVREMGELARLLRQKRFGRGSLDFDFPEPDVELDHKGRPLNIRKRERLEAHRLIEDFMILANETVARHMSGHPFLYRIHETPDPVRAEKLKKTLEALGLSVSKDLSRPASLAKLLKDTDGTPLQPVVHLMILRSLKQAIYAPVNKGHYGLGSACYTHFTSPIRRYPDLLVHRLLKERIRDIDRRAHWTTALPSWCEHSSARERVAVEAEREFMDIQKTRMMEPHVGETFTGVITSVTNFGFFVQLDTYFVEGLVHVTTLGRDFFIFDENRMTLKGRRNGQVFAPGNKVNVLLVATNVLKHQLEFELVHQPSAHPKKPHRFSRHRPTRS